MSDKSPRILGCDIGSGFAFVSVLLDPEADPLPLLPAKYGITSTGMPTTAWVSPDGHIEVFPGGHSAEKVHRRSPEQLVRAVKTRLKAGNLSLPSVKQPVRASAVYAAAAHDLVQLAEEALAEKGLEPIYDLVLTFPAAFADDPELLDELQEAVENIDLQGRRLRVRGRLPEAAAAGIDYLYYLQHLAPETIRIRKDHFTALVYDLGHGTFDAAVVTTYGGGKPCTLHLQDGLPDTGGRDFDERLYSEFLLRLREDYQYEPASAPEKEAILAAAVEAKEDLSESETYTADIPCGDYFQIQISRSEFEDLCSDLIYRTLTVTRELLLEADEKNLPIDCVVLSGGASRMPMVKRLLDQLLEDPELMKALPNALPEGRCPVVLYRPSEAVSYGAARFAAGIAEAEAAQAEETAETEAALAAGRSVLEQLTGQALGLLLPDAARPGGIVRILIPKGTERPAVSGPLAFHSPSDRVVLQLYASRQAVDGVQTAEPAVCESILRIPFDVPAGEACTLTITAMENYDIQAEIQTSCGSIKKTGADLLEQLHGGT